MGIFGKKNKNFVEEERTFDDDFYHGPGDEDNVVGDDDDDDLIPPAPHPVKKAPTTNPGSLQVVTPHSAQDGMIIADYLVHGYTVVMNIEALDRGIIVRLIDFLNGALHVLNGEMRRVSQSTFVLSPTAGSIAENAAPTGGEGGEEYR